MGIYVLKGLLKKLFWVALSIQNKNADSWLQKKTPKNLRYFSDQNIKANIQGTILLIISVSYTYDITSMGHDLGHYYSWNKAEKKRRFFSLLE